MPSNTKKRSAPRGKVSSSSSSSGGTKRRKVGSGRAAQALAEAQARSKRAISRLGESGVVSRLRPSERRLEIGATTEAVACDNQNVTKKAGKGKVRHLFVLPGHLDLLKFASSVRAKKKSKSGGGRKPQETEAAAAAVASATASASSSAARSAASGAIGPTSSGGAISEGQADRSASMPLDAPSAQDLQKAMNSFGAVAELGTGKPVLYIDVPARGGRIKLCGTIVYPDAPLLTLQLPPASSKSNSIVCDNVFDNMVVFDNVSWVENDSAPASPLKVKLELDKADLQKEREKFTGRCLAQNGDAD